jgi:glycosyltransferase involved in cell wall biosynthesis
MKLVIVSHVIHYESEGHLYAYAPYAREIDVWADLFDQVVIAAPLRAAEPAGDCTPLVHSNITIVPQRELGGDTWKAKLKLALFLPAMVWELCKVLRQADAVHVRCPSNISFLGTILAPLFSRRVIAKFAGQWNCSAVDPLSVRVQKCLLSSRWWCGPVTVYGKWPGQSKHVVPFFSSALTDDQVARASLAIQKRTPEQDKHVLFVGRLSPAKNVDALLNALGRLRKEQIPAYCTIAGTGPELSNLQELADALGLSDAVKFIGGVGFDRVLDEYARSGILVLASQTEGWPKAIVEGMTFGLIPIGSNLGLIPQMLDDGRGLLVPPGDVDALTNSLRNILAAPDGYSEMRMRAANWAREYSLDALRDSLKNLLSEHWRMQFPRGVKTQEIASVAPIHE